MATDNAKAADVLMRKYEREKIARKAAEKQLEEYSLQVYQSQINLQQSLRQAKQRETELQFLADLSAFSGKETSTQQLSHTVIELTCQFLQGHSGLAITDADNAEFYQVESGWDSYNHKITDYLALLPNMENTLTESWLVLPVDEESPLVDEAIRWLLFMNFPLVDNTMGTMAIFLPTDYLDEENLYVMETARRHILSGVSRRNNEHQIIRRSQELQTTLDELEIAHQQLIQSEKMASLGQLSAGIAHEINNPLSYVKSNLETLQEYLQQVWLWGADMRQHLDVNGGLEEKDYRGYFEARDIAFLQDDSQDIMVSVLNGLMRVREIIADLKTFSHQGSSEFKPMCLQECINSALKIAWNTLKYDYTLDKKIASDLLEITGNTGQLQQVFVNLLVNAGQAMSEGGTLTIEAFNSDHGVQVNISDTGSGMGEETIKKLFTPFFTTKPVGVGTGLGLSVSYGILNSHNVSIDVQSKIGEGTTFSLLFPLNHEGKE